MIRRQDWRRFTVDRRDPSGVIGIREAQIAFGVIADANRHPLIFVRDNRNGCVYLTAGQHRSRRIL